MAEQQKKKVERPKGDGDGDAAAANPEVSKKGKKIKEDLDKLLDEIDDILEENAEEFVKSYVQRGGRVGRDADLRVPLRGLRTVVRAARARAAGGRVPGLRQHGRDASPVPVRVQERAGVRGLGERRGGGAAAAGAGAAVTDAGTAGGRSRAARGRRAPFAFLATARGAATWKRS